jgi:hypothetical protein
MYCDAPSTSQKWVVASIGDDHLNRYRMRPAWWLESEEDLSPGPLSMAACKVGHGDAMSGHVDDSNRVTRSETARSVHHIEV